VPVVRHIPIEQLRGWHGGFFGHAALSRTAELVGAYLTAPNLAADAAALTCDSCALRANRKGASTRHLKKMRAWQSWDLPSRVWEKLVLDIGHNLEDDGYRYMLLVVDALTSFVAGMPLKTNDSQAICNALEVVFSLYGTPAVVVLDRARYFVSAATVQFLELRGVAVRKASAKSKGTTGAAENAIRRVRDALGGAPREWVRSFYTTLHACNSLPRSDTGVSAFALIFGRQPNEAQLAHSKAARNTIPLVQRLVETAGERVALAERKNAAREKRRGEAERRPTVALKAADPVYYDSDAATGKLDAEERWLHATIVRRSLDGPYHYDVRVDRTGKVHTGVAADRLIPRSDPVPDFDAAFDAAWRESVRGKGRDVWANVLSDSDDDWGDAEHDAELDEVLVEKKKGGEGSEASDASKAPVEESDDKGAARAKKVRFASDDELDEAAPCGLIDDRAEAQIDLEQLQPPIAEDDVRALVELIPTVRKSGRARQAPQRDTAEGYEQPSAHGMRK